ncbi:MAG: hydantoinase/oxoprolinase family protein [Pigmentiphaga sp.]|uniref:hydantoinase/oxoprolinase family protein n=1 Tax=Pigmentiphaga sp. TaxID=1977564 RepID=UPI0029AA5918|nr:hydantoinase/oxoprolinase family protein [Pigmentiphaga sp.]MDX3906955.1 hydantoinase/oxoprolinase family protein [Pigmentiphaga sp.]
MSEYWIGIDTGGTFTDLVLGDTRGGLWHYHKVPTLTADPAQGILNGIAEIMSLAAVDPAQVGFLVLGTTLATNAVLEGQWAPTGLITTQGFGDVLNLARQRRPHYFNLDVPKPTPPVPDDCRAEVAERIAAGGEVVTPLQDEDVVRAIDALRSRGVQTVAICFLHAYQNPAHEERARRLVAQHWPEAYVSVSSEVLPEFREYERFITTVVNASLMPVMDDYLQRFEMGVRDLGVRSSPHVMQSNGGAVTTQTVRQRPINTFFSGPAGGVVSTAALGEACGVRNLITFDMGGTSTDVCLIRDGRPAMKSERDMGGFPVRTRTLDIHTIGAGGGSLAWLDAGGLLKVGPKSASAYPGPASYGRGGTKPTVTDANVLLGRLSPVALLGGRMSMHPELAAQAIRDEIATTMGRSAEEVAIGILEIANANMTGAVRVISVEQGEDPRDYALVAFGGAGPLHAADVAAMAGMRHVIVPPRPGLMSAQGLLQSDRQGDFSLTRLVPATPDRLPSLNAGLGELARRAGEWLASEGASHDTPGVSWHWQLDLRYLGQNAELILDIAAGELDAAALARAVDAYHARHADLYGYDMRTHGVEVVNLRVSIVIARERLQAAAIAPQGVQADAAAGAPTRRVWFPATGFVDTPVLQRDDLLAGACLAGPAILEQMDTTTVIPPGSSTRVGVDGSLHIDLTPGAPGKETH